MNEVIFMCISRDKMIQVLNEVKKEEIRQGSISLTPCQWQGLIDDYVDGKSENSDLEKQEVAEIYQLFTIKLMMNSFQEYLSHS